MADPIEEMHGYHDNQARAFAEKDATLTRLESSLAAERERNARLVAALKRASTTVKRYRRAGHGDDVFFDDLCQTDALIDAALTQESKP